MLQRIQTVYLSLVVIIAVSLFFLPLAVVLSNTGPGNTQVADMLKITGVVKSSNEAFGVDKYSEKMSIPWPLIIFNATAGLMALLTVFMYANRKKQMLYCRINLVLICLFTAVIFWMADNLKRNSGGQLTYLFGTYLPVIQLILTYLAERAIKKDDDLVKSADRLR